MKRILMVMATVLAAGLLLFGQSAGDDLSKDAAKSNKGASISQGPVSGWICNSKCVKSTGEKSMCDSSCTDQSGDAVLVDDDGNVMKIASSSQPMVKQHQGHHMKMMADMDEEKMELDRIHFLNQQAP